MDGGVEWYGSLQWIQPKITKMMLLVVKSVLKFFFTNWVVNCAVLIQNSTLWSQSGKLCNRQPDIITLNIPTSIHSSASVNQQCPTTTFIDFTSHDSTPGKSAVSFFIMGHIYYCILLDDVVRMIHRKGFNIIPFIKSALRVEKSHEIIIKHITLH